MATTGVDGLQTQSVNVTSLFTTVLTSVAEVIEDQEDEVVEAVGRNLPEFELILPCIFGTFVVLSLSLIMFYSKKASDCTEDGTPTKNGDLLGATPNGTIEHDRSPDQEYCNMYENHFLRGDFYRDT